jgi:hypothetical protein
MHIRVTDSDLDLYYAVRGVCTVWERVPNGRSTRKGGMKGKWAKRKVAKRDCAKSKVAKLVSSWKK